MKTEIRKKEKHRFNGSLELHAVRGRDKERERENRKTLFQKIMHSVNVLYICVCSMHTFYTSPYKD